ESIGEAIAPSRNATASRENGGTRKTPGNRGDAIDAGIQKQIDAGNRRADQCDGAIASQRVDHRRKRRRQRSDREFDSSSQSSLGTADGETQLRGLSANDDRGRVVRIRQRRVYRSDERFSGNDRRSEGKHV